MQSASLSTEGVGPAGGGAGDAQHGVGQRVGGGGVGGDLQVLGNCKKSTVTLQFEAYLK